jgi:TP901 family phage tail tape measure protein
MSKFVLTAQLELKAPRNTNQVLNQIRGQLQGVNIEASFKEGKNVRRDIDALTKSTKELNKQKNQLAKSLVNVTKRYAGFFLASRAVGTLTSSLSDAVKQAIDFEQEILKISQVTGKAISQLDGLASSVTRLSTSLGVASTDIIGVGRILSQAGFKARDLEIAITALAKTELAPTFTDIRKTAEGVVAIFNQFGQGAAALETQLGAINKVAGQFAVESDDLIDAVRRAGGVFDSAGGSLNEFIALFTSVRATTRESAESIATGLRTIFTRIQRPKTIEFLRQYGVELLDLEGKFVGPFEAVNRLNKAFAGLDQGDITFVKVAEELGGFRQIGKVIPLIQQFGKAQAALGVAQQGAGSLSEDAAKAQLTLANSFIKTKEEFLALVRSITSSDTFQTITKSVLALSRAFIKVADSLTPILPLITAVGAVKLGKAIPGILSGVGDVLSGVQGRNQGGKILQFNTGGVVPGVGNRDTVPAMLTPGEFVIRKSSVQKIGADKLSQMNRGGKAVKRSNYSGGPRQKFEDGGSVGIFDSDQIEDKKLANELRALIIQSKKAKELIWGPAGAGKTTYARQLYGENFIKSKEDLEKYNKIVTLSGAQLTKGTTKVGGKEVNLSKATVDLIRSSNDITAIIPSQELLVQRRLDRIKNAQKAQAGGDTRSVGQLQATLKAADEERANKILEIFKSIKKKKTKVEEVRPDVVQKLAKGGVVDINANNILRANSYKLLERVSDPSRDDKGNIKVEALNPPNFSGNIGIAKNFGKGKDPSFNSEFAKPDVLAKLQELGLARKDGKPRNSKDLDRTFGSVNFSIDVAGLNAEPFNQFEAAEQGIRDSVSSEVDKLSNFGAAGGILQQQKGNYLSSLSNLFGRIFEDFTLGLSGLTSSPGSSVFDINDPKNEKSDLSAITNEKISKDDIGEIKLNTNDKSIASVLSKGIRGGLFDQYLKAKAAQLGVQKLNAGGIVNENELGAAILEAGGLETGSATVSVDALNKKLGFASLAKGASPVGRYVQGKTFGLKKQGLDQATSDKFSDLLKQGFAQGTNFAVAGIAGDIGVAGSPIPDSDFENFYSGVRPALIGDLFEAALRSFRDSGVFAQEEDPERPFDFTSGLGGGLSAYPSLQGLNYVDAKNTYGVASDKELEKKAVNQLALELAQAGIKDQPVGRKAVLEKKGVDIPDLPGFPKRKGFNRGGPAGSDTVPAMLTPGEFVINKQSAQRIGYGNLNRMNKNGVLGFSTGGPVPGVQYLNEGARVKDFEQTAGGILVPAGTIEKPTSDQSLDIDGLQKSIDRATTAFDKLSDPIKETAKQIGVIAAAYKRAIDNIAKNIADSESGVNVQGTTGLTEEIVRLTDVLLKMSVAATEVYLLLQNNVVAQLTSFNSSLSGTSEDLAFLELTADQAAVSLDKFAQKLDNFGAGDKAQSTGEIRKDKQVEQAVNEDTVQTVDFDEDPTVIISDASISSVADAISNSLTDKLSSNVVEKSPESKPADQAASGSGVQTEEQEAAEELSSSLAKTTFQFGLISGAVQGATTFLERFKVEAEFGADRVSTFGSVINASIDGVSSLAEQTTQVAATLASTAALLSDFGVELSDEEGRGLLSGDTEAFESVSKKFTSTFKDLGQQVKDIGFKKTGQRIKIFSDRIGKAATSVTKFAGQAFLAVKAFTIVTQALDFLAGRSEEAVKGFIEAGDIVRATEQEKKNIALESQNVIAGTVGVIGTLLGGPIVGGIAAATTKVATSLLRLIPGVDALTTAFVDSIKELPLIGQLFGEVSGIREARVANAAELVKYTKTIAELQSAEKERVQTAKLLGKSEAEITLEGLTQGTSESAKTFQLAKRTEKNVVQRRVDDEAVRRTADRLNISEEQVRSGRNAADAETRTRINQELQDQSSVVRAGLTDEDREQIDQAEAQKKETEAAFTQELLNAFKTNAVAGGTTDIKEFVDSLDPSIQDDANEALRNQKDVVDALVKTIERERVLRDSLNVGLDSELSRLTDTISKVNQVIARSEGAYVGLEASLANVTQIAEGTASQLSDSDFARTLNDVENTIRANNQNQPQAEVDKKVERARTALTVSRGIQANQEAAVEASKTSASPLKTFTDTLLKDVENADLKRALEEKIQKKIEESGGLAQDVDLSQITDLQDVVSDELGESIGEIGNLLEGNIELQKTLNGEIDKRINLERQLADAQENYISILFESRGLQEEFGNREFSNNEKNRLLREQFNPRATQAGVGGLTTGSVTDIRNVNAQIANAAQASNQRRIDATQGGAPLSPEEAANTEDLKTANDKLIGFTRSRIDLLKEEIELVKKKNAEEKSALEKLITGDIEGFIQGQISAGAAAALETGDTNAARLFSPTELGAGFLSLEKAGAATTDAARATLDAFGISDGTSASVLSGDEGTEALNQEIVQLARTLEELAQTQKDFATLDIQAQQVVIAGVQSLIDGNGNTIATTTGGGGGQPADQQAAAQAAADAAAAGGPQRGGQPAGGAPAPAGGAGGAGGTGGGAGGARRPAGGGASGPAGGAPAGGPAAAAAAGAATGDVPPPPGADPAKWAEILANPTTRRLVLTPDGQPKPNLKFENGVPVNSQGPIDPSDPRFAGANGELRQQRNADGTPATFRGGGPQSLGITGAAGAILGTDGGGGLIGASVANIENAAGAAREAYNQRGLVSAGLEFIGEGTGGLVPLDAIGDAVYGTAIEGGDFTRGGQVGATDTRELGVGERLLRGAEGALTVATLGQGSTLYQGARAGVGATVRGGANLARQGLTQGRAGIIQAQRFARSPGANYLRGQAGNLVNRGVQAGRNFAGQTLQRGQQIGSNVLNYGQRTLRRGPLQPFRDVGNAVQRAGGPRQILTNARNTVGQGIQYGQNQLRAGIIQSQRFARSTGAPQYLQTQARGALIQGQRGLNYAARSRFGQGAIRTGQYIADGARSIGQPLLSGAQRIARPLTNRVRAASIQTQRFARSPGAQAFRQRVGSFVPQRLRDTVGRIGGGPGTSLYGSTAARRIALGGAAGYLGYQGVSEIGDAFRGAGLGDELYEQRPELPQGPQTPPGYQEPQAAAPLVRQSATQQRVQQGGAVPSGPGVGTPLVPQAGAGAAVGGGVGAADFSAAVGQLGNVFQQFSDAVNKLADIKISVKLDPTTVKIDLAGTSFLGSLTEQVKQELLAETGRQMQKQYTTNTGDVATTNSVTKPIGSA